jgi:D-3-phosphoglycerate dehydrogenase
VLAGLFKPILSTGVTVVNARSVAAEHGIEIVESRSTRQRNYTSLISIKIRTARGERWVEGAVFEKSVPRLVLIDGIAVEAPLEGTMFVITNRDQPGVIGRVGTILGKYGVNIATFALGRNDGHAVGVVIVDENEPIPEVVLNELRQVNEIQDVRLVRV